MDIGSIIKELRKKRGLTQRELANICGLSEISIRSYENNTRKPKIENLKKIANSLEVDVTDFYDWNKLNFNESSNLIGELISENKNEVKGNKISAKISYSIFDVLDFVSNLYPDKLQNIIDFIESPERSEFYFKILSEYENILKKIIDKDIKL